MNSSSAEISVRVARYPARSRSASKPSRPATPPPTIITLGFELRCPATTRSSYARDERNLKAAKIRLDLCASAASETDDPHSWLCPAEGVGFEPTRDLTAPNGF